jgi:hypothetical protein
MAGKWPKKIHVLRSRIFGEQRRKRKRGKWKTITRPDNSEGGSHDQ